MNRFRFFGFLWITMYLVMAISVNAQDSNERPNIVFIIADDVSWNDIGCYGNDFVKTPNLDNLAAQGIKFTNAYLTASSCSPSRNSIITGRYPHNTGAPELHMPIPLAQIPFPLLLKQSGYYTVQSGKAHFGPHAERAFNKFYEKEDAGDGGEERWVQCLKERPKDQPFFAWFGSTDAHRPWGADEFKITHDPAEIEVPPYLVDEASTRQDLASYYNEITRLDHYIGLVVEELAHQQILDNTIIMFVSDNGRPFPGCKTRVYDRGMKTPLVVHWPQGIREGLVSNSLVSVIDIAPTFLEAAGVNIVPEILGKSFLSLFEHPDMEFRNYVFSEHNWHDYESYERMVRTKNFLYLINERPWMDQRGPADSNKGASFEDLKVRRDAGKLTPAQSDIFMAPRPRYELYDCISDPGQLVNVASLKKYQQVKKDLDHVLAKWMKETRDNVPDNLTKDLFDRETGTKVGVWRFGELDKQRGEIPGVASGALEVKSSDISIF